MNLVLVDDHPVVRKGLKALLEENDLYRVVGEAGSGAEAVSLIRNLSPEVAIVDIKLPDINGFQVAAAAKAQAPGTRIIMLSMHADEFHVREALRSGADGYVVKNAMEHEIIDAITAVTTGSRYVSRMLSGASSGGPSPEAAAVRRDDRSQKLTRREHEIFCLIAQGWQNKQIAEKLFISPRTVETHRAKIMRKLRLGSHAELIHLAVRMKIIDLA
jgi:DNA-binding NarL/FixJ family response regulator